MDSVFSYADLKSELTPANIVQDISSIFLTVNGNGEAIQKPAGLHRLPSERPEPVFDVNLSAMTLEQVEEHCITNGQRLATITQTVGNKVFY
jgi:hypothetical protein